MGYLGGTFPARCRAQHGHLALINLSRPEFGPRPRRYLRPQKGPNGTHVRLTASECWVSQGRGLSGQRLVLCCTTNPDSVCFETGYPAPKRLEVSTLEVPVPTRVQQVSSTQSWADFALACIKGNIDTFIPLVKLIEISEDVIHQQRYQAN